VKPGTHQPGLVGRAGANGFPAALFRQAGRNSERVELEGPPLSVIWHGVGKPGKLSLYDLANDIGETNDLAAKHPEIAAKLTGLMQKAWAEPRSQEADGTYTGRDEGH
jgi:hypothetical protein